MRKAHSIFLILIVLLISCKPQQKAVDTGLPKHEAKETRIAEGSDNSDLFI